MIRLWKNRGAARILLPLSFLYRAAVAIRNRRFDSSKNGSTQLNARVISIGNITVGGTGKTPLVMAVAETLQTAGQRVAILSRGYGRNTRYPVVVSDGTRIHGETMESGDEPLMMARRLSRVPIIVGSDRSRTGRMAVERFHPDCVVLDDGFQHRQVARDLDVITLDAIQPFGNRWTPPLPDE